MSGAHAPPFDSYSLLREGSMLNELYAEVFEAIKSAST